MDKTKMATPGAESNHHPMSVFATCTDATVNCSVYVDSHTEGVAWVSMRLE